MANENTAVPTCGLCHYHEWSVDPNPETGFGHKRPYRLDQLRQSAQLGCPGCKTLHHVWSSLGLSEDYMYITQKKRSLSIRIGLPMECREIEAYTLPGEREFEHVKVANPLPESPHLKYNLPTIQSWLRTCEHEHEACKGASQYTPLRLLDLAHDNTDMVKLVRMSPGSDGAPQYACLSHCWGKTRSQHNTTTTTLQKNLQGIAVSELPKTFREAIEIARALQIRYLWADSLCIVQDDDSDWRQHVEAMAWIYENSHVTLAAGASVDDDGGFFVTSHNEITKIEPLELRIDDQVYHLHFRQIPDHPDSLRTNETFPLMQRGWCFQERLLSRRFLCFGREEVLWECREEVACSCSVSCSLAAGPFNLHLGNNRKGFRNSRLAKADMYASGYGDGTEAWRSLMPVYTKQRLTYPGDKLPALAGLANAFDAIFNLGHYAHGMWVSSLTRDIAWFNCSSKAVQHGRPRNGPSWSWAYANDGAIGWHAFNHLGQYHQVHGLVCDSLGSTQPWDSLVLTGYLSPISLQMETEDVQLTFSWICCHVIEHRRRHSETSFQAVLPSKILGELVTGSMYGQEKKQTRDADMQYELQPRGLLRMDYIFWSNKEELCRQLQHVMFLVLDIMAHSSLPDPLKCSCYSGPKSMVSGVVLRSADGIAPCHSNMSRYERIGWLSYEIPLHGEDWKPSGVCSKFLIV